MCFSISTSWNTEASDSNQDEPAKMHENKRSCLEPTLPGSRQMLCEPLMFCKVRRAKHLKTRGGDTNRAFGWSVEEEITGSFNMADVVTVAAGDPSLVMCLHMDILASLSFSMMDGWKEGGWVGAAAVTPGGADMLHQQNRCGQSALFFSPVSKRKEVKAHIWVTYWIWGINWRNVLRLVQLTEVTAC